MQSCRRALSTNADRGRISRTTRLRHDHQQPVGELGGRPPPRRPRYRFGIRPRGRSPRRPAALLRRPSRRPGPTRGRRRGRSGSDSRRRDRHSGSGGGVVRDRDVASRARRSRNSRAHQLRDQPRDAARDRRRARCRRPRFRRRLATRYRARRLARADWRDATHLGDLPAQPHGNHARPRVTARTRRTGRTVGRGPARRRDLPRPDARIGAAPGGDAHTASDQRLVHVEGIRPAGAARRLGGLSRSATGRDPARGQGADRHLRRDDRRGDRGSGLDGSGADPPADP